MGIILSDKEARAINGQTHDKMSGDFQVKKGKLDIGRFLTCQNVRHAQQQPILFEIFFDNYTLMFLAKQETKDMSLMPIDMPKLTTSLNVMTRNFVFTALS